MTESAMTPEVKDKVAAAAGKILDAEVVSVPEPDSKALALPKGAEWLANFNSFDWERVPPHVMAMLLTQKRFSTGDGGYLSLTLPEALTVAITCYENGWNPFTTEVWIDPQKKTVNPTTEGLQKTAARKNIGYEIAPFVDLDRPWPERLPELPGVKKDLGVKCELHIAGKTRPVQYTAWLSEWGVRWERDKDRKLTAAKWMSPQWEERTANMLRKRSYNHALEDLLGVGGSGMPNDAQLDPKPPVDAAGTAATGS